jgi:hypothetical protein
MISWRASLISATTRSRRARPIPERDQDGVVGRPQRRRRVARSDLHQSTLGPRSSRSASHQKAHWKQAASALVPTASSMHAELDAVLERLVEVRRRQPRARARRRLRVDDQELRVNVLRGPEQHLPGERLSSSFLCWSDISCSKVSSSRTTLPMRCSDAVSCVHAHAALSRHEASPRRAARRRGGRTRAERPLHGAVERLDEHLTERRLVGPVRHTPGRQRTPGSPPCRCMTSQPTGAERLGS